jgi:hypothetical protein
MSEAGETRRALIEPLSKGHLGAAILYGVAILLGLAISLHGS